ncbi:MAG TPA: CopG family transcriptional regulator [Acidimicrobiales bacterium]|nr:CopG family transcriptional regulator [Acidimicrobiales bacterium]
MSKKIDDLLAEEGAAAENYDIEYTVPEGVAVARPNLGRATVVSVRLSADEHARLQRAAEKANLPVSTLIRIWALDRLRAEDEGSESSVAERLRRLEQAVFQRSA